MIEKIANNVSIKTRIKYSISLRYYGLLVEMEFRNTQRICTNTILKVEKSLLILVYSKEHKDTCSLQVTFIES